MRIRAAVLATLTTCLVAVPAASQVTGVPIIANPKSRPGITAAGVVTYASGQAGGGLGSTAEIDWTVGRVTLRALVGSRHPREEFSLPVDLTGQIEGYAVYGAAGAIPLLGGSGDGLAVSMHGGIGFEGRHRAVAGSTIVVMPSRAKYTLTVAVGLRERLWGMDWEPWAGGGLRWVDFDLGELPRCEGVCLKGASGVDTLPGQWMPGATVHPGISGGLDLWLTHALCVRVAFDVTQTDVPVLTISGRWSRLILLEQPAYSVRTRPRLFSAGFRVRFPTW